MYEDSAARPDFNSELDEKQRKRFSPTEHWTCFLNKGFKSNKLFIKNLLKDSNFRWWAGPVEQFYVPKLSNFNFISCNPTFHPCLWSVIVLQLDSQLLLAVKWKTMKSQTVYDYRCSRTNIEVIIDVIIEH